VDLFEQASFLLNGNFVASVCGAFGVFYFFVAAASVLTSVYIMHSVCVHALRHTAIL
jgi:hypothetical protein